MNMDPRLLRQVEQLPYPLVFVTISGAHLYGFPSSDSDYDLRGVQSCRFRMSSDWNRDAKQLKYQRWIAPALEIALDASKFEKR